jgi:hypothetical protein
MKKYEMTSNTKEFSGHKLFQIKALKNFGSIKAGDLGGYIEKEENLSHDGRAWVYNNAKVYDNAEVCGDAKIYDNAEVLAMHGFLIMQRFVVMRGFSITH